MRLGSYVLAQKQEAALAAATSAGKSSSFLKTVLHSSLTALHAASAGLVTPAETQLDDAATEPAAAAESSASPAVISTEDAPSTAEKATGAEAEVEALAAELADAFEEKPISSSTSKKEVDATDSAKSSTEQLAADSNSTADADAENNSTAAAENAADEEAADSVSSSKEKAETQELLRKQVTSMLSKFKGVRPIAPSEVAHLTLLKAYKDSLARTDAELSSMPSYMVNVSEPQMERVKELTEQWHNKKLQDHQLRDKLDELQGEYRKAIDNQDIVVSENPSEMLSVVRRLVLERRRNQLRRMILGLTDSLRKSTDKAEFADRALVSHMTRTEEAANVELDPRLGLMLSYMGEEGNTMMKEFLGPLDERLAAFENFDSDSSLAASETAEATAAAATEPTVEVVTTEAPVTTEAASADATDAADASATA